MRRPGQLKFVAGVLVAGAAAAALVAFVFAGRGGSAQAPLVPPPRLPGALTGPAPWPRNVGLLRERLAALGLPALPEEGTTVHTHQHLDLYVDGRRVGVPAGIGLDAGEHFIAPIHTHDGTGIIHVESPKARTFSLGQFFGVWGVRFTPRCLGGYCATGAGRLWVFVDGRLVRGDPRRVVLAEHEEIVVAFGARAQLPRPIPRSYAFPSGL